MSPAPPPVPAPRRSPLVLALLLLGALLTVLIAAACGQDIYGPPEEHHEEDDGGQDGGGLDGSVDASVDAGPSDGGNGDAGDPDAGPTDGGNEDAGEPDGGEPDAGTFDGGFDAGVDAGLPDAGPVTTHVVISEIGTSSTASPNDEFVELYNPTASAVTLTGWKLQYRSNTGSNYSLELLTFPAVSIQPHRYLLIALNAYAGPTSDLAPSSTGTFLSANGGHVRLGTASLGTALSDVNVVDLVGWGTAVGPEGGTSATAAPSGMNQSIERKASASSTALTMNAGGADDGRGNGYDTDLNSADFIVSGTRNPQNSASPAEP